MTTLVAEWVDESNESAVVWHEGKPIGKLTRSYPRNGKQSLWLYDGYSIVRFTVGPYTNITQAKKAVEFHFWPQGKKDYNRW